MPRGVMGDKNYTLNLIMTLTFTQSDSLRKEKKYR